MTDQGVLDKQFEITVSLYMYAMNLEKSQKTATFILRYMISQNNNTVTI
jgi:hypothetical protein